MNIINTISKVYNESWEVTTSRYPDNYFDWVIDDFPYGIDVGNMAFLKENNTTVKQKNGTKLNPNKKRNFTLLNNGIKNHQLKSISMK